MPLINVRWRSGRALVKKIVKITILVVVFYIFFQTLPQGICINNTNFNPGIVYAQNQDQWSPPEQIPYYYDMLRAPILIADQANTVHAFDLRADSFQDFTILYRRWDKDQGWSIPFDIIIPNYAGSAPILRGVALDDEGYLHLIYFGGDLSGGNIFYSSAHVSQAADSRNWSDPIPITSYARPDATATIKFLPEGKLVVLYAGERNATGLYEVHSNDGGQTWSDARLLSRAKGKDLFPASIWLEFDDQERLHVVWHLANPLGLGVEIRYANIDQGLNSWEYESVIAYAETEMDLLGWPSIISRQGELVLVYQDGFPPTRWVVYSNDLGKTWSEPIRPFPHRGGYGVAYLLKDSAGEIHIVLGNRLQDPEIRGMWYSKLVGDQWLPLSPIISGPAEDSFGPCCPQAVISQGNVLLATWPHNVGREFLTGAWYSYTDLGAPDLPRAQTLSLPDPTESNQGLVLSLPTSESRPTSTPEFAITESRNPGSGALSLSNPLFIGLIPILVVIGSLFIFRRRTYQRRESESSRLPE